MNLSNEAIFFIIFISLLCGFSAGHSIGVEEGLTKISPSTEKATYVLHGDHQGTITFLKDGSGYAFVDGKADEFTWKVDGVGLMENGTIYGRIIYWGVFEIPTELFPGNLTMTSPKFPGTSAVMQP